MGQVNKFAVEVPPERSAFLWCGPAARPPKPSRSGSLRHLLSPPMCTRGAPRQRRAPPLFHIMHYAYPRRVLQAETERAARGGGAYITMALAPTLRMHGPRAYRGRSGWQSVVLLQCDVVIPSVWVQDVALLPRIVASDLFELLDHLGRLRKVQGFVPLLV